MAPMSDMHEDDNEEALADEKKVEAAMADSKMASLFDIRLVVGGVLVIYGAILTVMGIVDSSKAVQKAAGIRINLWTGLAMLALGALFLLWISGARCACRAWTPGTSRTTRRRPAGTNVW